MTDVIKLLPDAVANQIAAGEVIQRPASVVKELTENAIDAGSTHISVIVKDAGRTLIQVVDNGGGMSPTDARMSFERHATSKIQSAQDLFSLNTKGFRGEALASIAAVAQVELKSKRDEDEVGTLIEINGSTVERQDFVSAPKGTSISVKNLFYNIPARRKFLKTNSTEFRHILSEFHRVALATPQIGFSLYHNDEIIYDLEIGNYATRIAGIFGKNSRTRFVEVSLETSLVKVTGFIGKPEYAKKKSNDQYFFINDRYMRHPYFHRAVVQAYGNLLPPDTVPGYFLYFDIDPATIDINIHPTKTEIKFENEQNIWPILMAGVKEGLGKFNVVAPLDFDQEGSVNMPVIDGATEVTMPSIDIDPTFNPFKTSSSFEKSYGTSSGAGWSGNTRPSAMNTGSQPKIDGWESMYEFEKEGSANTLEFESEIGSETIVKQSSLSLPDKPDGVDKRFFQYKEQYILTSVKSGLMLIEQQRAHYRILYERNLQLLRSKQGVGQALLFPDVLIINPEQKGIMDEILKPLKDIGFGLKELSAIEFEINAIPEDLMNKDYLSALNEVLVVCADDINAHKELLHEKMAATLAYRSAIKGNKVLQEVEMEGIVDQLFACETPNYTPDGEIVVSILSTEDIINKFN